MLEPCRSWVSAHRKPSRGHKVYLACKDDDLIDRPGSLLHQELTDDKATCQAGADNSEVLVSRHVLIMCSGGSVWGYSRLPPPPIYTLSSRLDGNRHFTVTLMKPLTKDRTRNLEKASCGAAGRRAITMQCIATDLIDDVALYYSYYP